MGNMREYDSKHGSFFNFLKHDFIYEEQRLTSIKLWLWLVTDTIRGKFHLLGSKQVDNTFIQGDITVTEIGHKDDYPELLL